MEKKGDLRDTPAFIAGGNSRYEWNGGVNGD